MAREQRAWETSRRWSEAEARAALSELAESGLSVAEFASRHGVAVERLYRWRSVLGLTSSSGSRIADFAEVTLPAPRRVPAIVEIVTLSGRIVRVGEHFDEGMLRRVLAAVDGDEGERSC